MTADEKELLEALKSMTRIVEAFRYSAGLGKMQVERLDAAKKTIKKYEAPL